MNDLLVMQFGEVFWDNDIKFQIKRLVNEFWPKSECIIKSRHDGWLISITKHDEKIANKDEIIKLAKNLNYIREFGTQIIVEYREAPNEPHKIFGVKYLAEGSG